MEEKKNIYDISKKIVDNHIDKFSKNGKYNYKIDNRSDFISIEAKFISELREHSDRMFFVPLFELLIDELTKRDIIVNSKYFFKLILKYNRRFFYREVISTEHDDWSDKLLIDKKRQLYAPFSKSIFFLEGFNFKETINFISKKIKDHFDKENSNEERYGFIPIYDIIDSDDVYNKFEEEYDNSGYSNNYQLLI
ncbi:MAG: hypothetical protein ACOCP8_06785 [archaeon]